jgi:hypothetical protein
LIPGSHWLTPLPSRGSMAASAGSSSGLALFCHKFLNDAKLKL